jgi:putative phosphoesterase
MRIALISDIHDNIANLQKVLDFCARQKIETIICCGDLASLDTLDYINENFPGTIHYTFGNMDDEHLVNFKFGEKYKNTFVYQNFGEAEVGNKRVAFVHYPEAAQELCQTGKYNFVFHGHTHKPWSAEASAKETRGSKKCTILNPGNVTGTFYPPTFAVWNVENDKFELIRINGLK